jgi:hypothetical protein
VNKKVEGKIPSTYSRCISQVPCGTAVNKKVEGKIPSTFILGRLAFISCTNYNSSSVPIR